MGPCRLNDKNDDILSREVRVKRGVIHIIADKFSLLISSLKYHRFTQ